MSKVTHLTSNDFDSNGNIPNYSKGLLTVAFLASWCGHCQHFKPVYEEVAKLTRCLDSGCAYIDADESKDLIKKLNGLNLGFTVNGFPTIIQYKNGKYYRTFGGNRSADSVLAFVCGN
jgi:thiol-disulfide isomerase/thioredoxin